MGTYTVTIELEVTAENEEEVQQVTETYLQELINDGSLDISWEESGPESRTIYSPFS